MDLACAKGEISVTSGLMAKTVNPHIWISREVLARDEADRWAMGLGVDVNPESGGTLNLIGYRVVDTDGLWWQGAGAEIGVKKRPSREVGCIDNVNLSSRPSDHNLFASKLEYASIEICCPLSARRDSLFGISEEDACLRGRCDGAQNCSGN